MPSKTKTAVSRTIFHVIVCAFGFIMLYPLLWMIASAFKDNRTIFITAHSLVPDPPVLDNFVQGWRGFAGISFEVFYKNSIFLAVVSTIGQVSSSAVVAFGFARIRFRFRQFWFVVMMLAMMLPSQVVMIPQYILFNNLGWVNTFLPLTVPGFFGSAFFIFLMMQFMSGIPRELDEAAKIDGCSIFNIFYRIILPLTTPALVTAGLFAFMWTWDNFFGSLLYLNSPTKYTVAIALKNFADPTGANDWGAIFAMSSLSLVPIFAIFFIFQKYLVEGISTTGLKA